MEPVPKPSRRRRSLTHPSVQLSNEDTQTSSSENSRAPVDRISDHLSHETSLDSIKDQIQKMIHSHKHSGSSSHHHHENPWEFLKDHIHKFGHKSDTSSHDSHEKTLDFLKDQLHKLTHYRHSEAGDSPHTLHKLTHRHSEAGDSPHSHENAWEFLKEHVQKIAHKGEHLSPNSSLEVDTPGTYHKEMISDHIKRASSDLGPLHFVRDQIFKLTHHYESSGTSHSHANSSEFRNDWLHRITRRSLTDVKLSSDPLGLAVMPYHGSYGSLIRNKKSAPMSPIIEGLDLDFPDFSSREPHHYYQESE